MQVEQLLNNPIRARTHTHTHTQTQYSTVLVFTEGTTACWRNLSGVQEGGDSWAAWWRSANRMVKCSYTDSFNIKRTDVMYGL